MLEFKNITIDEYNILKKFLIKENEPSCENCFVNILLWHGDVLNSYAIFEDTLIIKTQDKDSVMLRLPLGENFDGAMKAIYKHFNNTFPLFYGYEGETFNKFLKQYGDLFEITECVEDFEYVYSSENLISLSGKKYHSKRNHISAFSKKYDWHYEKIDSKNIEKIRLCANEWYLKNGSKNDDSLKVDKDESMTLLSNMERLNLTGGAIFIGEKAVAYTIGAPINDTIFDVMIEKALPEYATAYSVINREFAKHELSSYKYINREDDMGLEGLRKAKLSYKPEFLLKKYICSYKGD